MGIPKHILPTIVLAQFCCTSLWFACNAIIADLALNFNLGADAIGNLTSAIQFGFIAGTLTFAIFTITDRFSPSRVFFICALFGALCNTGLLWAGNTMASLIALRCLTGFFLAGIYPVGMKIASDYFNKGLGTSLGYLVGALVLGTAFPHLLSAFGQALPWKMVILLTATLALLGGSLLWALVPNGPFRKQSQKLQPKAFFSVFKIPTFRTAAFGYFGHMWELYSFWAFVPFLLAAFNNTYATSIHTAIWSFIIIALGGPACVIGGYLSKRYGPKRTAQTALLLSGCCCLLLPFVFLAGNSLLYITFLGFWGMVVIADSPLFSTLVAQQAPAALKGTALTIVNCIGFAITIVSILSLNYLSQKYGSIWGYTILLLGPLFGLYHLIIKQTKS